MFKTGLISLVIYLIAFICLLNYAAAFETVAERQTTDIQSVFSQAALYAVESGAVSRECIQGFIAFGMGAWNIYTMVNKGETIQKIIQKVIEISMGANKTLHVCGII